jgi:hypothetical protein
MAERAAVSEVAPHTVMACREPIASIAGDRGRAGGGEGYK